MRRSKENKLEVVGVRLDPAIAHRLRLLASVTGRKQSVFLQQIIEQGIGAIEEVNLPPEMVEQIRGGNLPPVPGETVTVSEPDLFGTASVEAVPKMPRRPREKRRVEEGERPTD
ncbi:RHH-type rel operon transcriptional repressor/antitoxin RelB [Paraburkholderia sp. HC6.4b]|uniref:hypothetical protein n=1 Tax=unclassified Paraburkholderia TaxID=2615204 RepID=UPI0018201D48|nr:MULTISPECIES: hypothetical protein [unclassified Paraburkholderia]MBB5409366.1 RHH-type rel operon transcriptional repressor/antitoxin RelB [Paraburkholderia sp. HC6.4b]MBB5451095.1 RHH-type rel operon transcriptional repressor/antitoxin RelB [Paraburkholderia sp. Kb1A]